MTDPNTRARDALRGGWLPGMVDCDGNRVTAAPSPTPNPYGCSASWVHDGETESCGDQPCPFCGWEPDDDEMDDPPEGWGVPDLDDRVTELALIAVIEARVGPVSVVVREESDGDREYAVQVPLVYGSRELGFGPTRKDALVAALEAT